MNNINLGEFVRKLAQLIEDLKSLGLIFPEDKMKLCHIQDNEPLCFYITIATYASAEDRLKTLTSIMRSSFEDLGISSAINSEESYLFFIFFSRE